MKPPGVIMARRCECELIVEESGPGATIFRLVPPQQNQSDPLVDLCKRLEDECRSSSSEIELAWEDVQKRVLKGEIQKYGIKAALAALVDLFPLDGVETGGEITKRMSLKPHELRLREDLIKALELYNEQSI